ncbi:MAG: ATP-dependent DNA helicase [Vulcanimicrobiaceae bacterium]
MNAPPLSLDEIFGAQGPLARTLGAFESRPGQLQMAKCVERGFLEGLHTLVDAGTGIGKSFAYLVPALRATQEGKRVVVSTATIALQEQLLAKDIPLVARALGASLRVVLLKGRSHYLCRAKEERLRADRLIASSATMEAIWAWAARTRSGDRAELSFLPPPLEWEALDADADDCTGELCGHYADCWYFRKRDEARYADLVVVNHALFFLDIATGGALLPAYDLAILDEAHHCEHAATDAFTATISRASVERLIRSLGRSYRVPAERIAALESALRELEHALSGTPGERFELDAAPDATLGLEALEGACYELENWLEAEGERAFRSAGASAAEMQRRRELALAAIAGHAQTAALLRAPGAQRIAWAERADERRLRVHATPVEVADILREHLFERRSSIVLASATLANGSSFAFTSRSLGIDERAQEYLAPSPFDLRRQARLYVAPSDFDPTAADFAQKAAPLVEEILEISRGRAFVLCTSYRRLAELHGLLAERIPFPARVQGALPRAALLDWFRTAPGAVLFATGTFWEGIDVVGEALSCVIVDRLPFPAPSDPLVAARMRTLAAAGEDGFAAYMIPAAGMRLKQGFGRLIRSEADRGALVLLDGRAASKGYGPAILAGLPPLRRARDLDELRAFFAAGGPDRTQT